MGDVVPVLEESWHLSYPFLIEDDGALWMIPESSIHGDVALYKCVRFPDKWERHATLLSGLELADATITRHNGLHYLFGAWRDGTGGYSDSLAIYYAEHLLGPWLPHAEQSGPDRSCEHATGRKFRHHQWQDCGARSRTVPTATVLRSGWRKLSSCRRPHSGRSFATRSSPDRHGPAGSCTPLNRCGRLEVIDGSRVQPKTRTPILMVQAVEPAMALRQRA